MKIYKKEIDLGLSDLVKANLTTAACAAPVDQKTFGETLRPKEELKWEQRYIPADVMQFSAILVSTVWNKNDDIFTREDTWKAYPTPHYKPVNTDHLGKEGEANEIFGTIYSAMPVNDSYMGTWESYEEESGEYEIPEDFKHILVGCYLWEKYFPTKTEAVKKGIESQTLFVSMECVFKDFGYGLKTEGSEEISLLPRNEATSWLTQHLRVYGGTGKVTINGVKYQVGRWLRDLVFSGMGIVPKPGNPDSIIFEDYISHASQKFNKVENVEDFLDPNVNISKSSENCVLNINNKGNAALWILK